MTWLLVTAQRWSLATRFPQWSIKVSKGRWVARHRVCGCPNPCKVVRSSAAELGQELAWLERVSGWWW